MRFTHLFPELSIESFKPSSGRLIAGFISAMLGVILWTACIPVDAVPLTFDHTPFSATNTLEPSPTEVDAGATVLANELPPYGSTTSIPGPLQSTQTPIKTSSPTIQIPFTPTPTLLPYLNQTSDLLYIADGNLFRWDHVTGYSVMLAENVESFSIDASGEKISLLRSLNVVANGVQMFDLEILDFESMQIYTVIEQSPRLHAISISPDGKWIAYTQSEEGGKVFIVNTDGEGNSTVMGECQHLSEMHCTQIAWSPDSRSILWIGKEGIWLSRIERSSPYLVQSSLVKISDPEGETIEMQVTFDRLIWSPSGRYALTHIIPSIEGVHWWTILDTFKRRMVSVPDSSEFASRTVGITWTYEGDLLMLHGDDENNHAVPSTNLWQIIPTKPEILLPKQTFNLVSDEISANLHDEINNIDYCVDWLIQRDQETFLMGVTSQGVDMPPTLFTMDISNGNLEKLSELPAESTSVIWSPDGLGALVIGEENLLIFLSTEDGATLELRSVLGNDAHSFIWLPPAPRI